MFDKHYAMVVFDIQEFRDTIFQMISKKEVILVSVILGCSFSEYDRSKYYKTSYIEDGIRLSCGKYELNKIDNYKILETGVRYCMEKLLSNYGEEIDILWRQSSSSKYTDRRYTSKHTKYLNICIFRGSNKTFIHIMKGGDYSTYYTNSSNSLEYCYMNHGMEKQQCYDFGLRSINLLLKSLLLYNTTDTIGYSCSLYSCVPMTDKHRLTDIKK